MQLTEQLKECLYKMCHLVDAIGRDTLQQTTVRLLQELFERYRFINANCETLCVCFNVSHVDTTVG